jgi:D-3-phosphoglycerate dehydrogenase
VDNIDIKAATEKGIVVVNTPNANATSVAEHTLTVIGALAKQMTVYNREMRVGKWEIRNSYRAVDLDGKTLGLVGVGRIGSMVARRAAAAFNMKVIAFDPYITPEKGREMGITLVSTCNDIFRQADVVSLHTPLTTETRGFVNASRLRLMKPTAFLINFSRGEVVDEKALYQALKTGVIAGAAIDVYDPEPPLNDNPLFELDNIILSPHSAALTQECVIRMATGAAEGVVEVLSGRPPQFVVNPDVFKK